MSERVLSAEAATSLVPSLLSAEQQAAWKGLPFDWVRTPPGAWRSTFEVPRTSLVLLESGRIATSIQSRGRTHDVEFMPNTLALFTGGTELKVHQTGCHNARRIIVMLEPTSVLDAGDGEGGLLDGAPLQPSMDFTDAELAAHLRAMLREMLDGSPNGALFSQSLSLGVLLRMQKTRGQRSRTSTERGKLTAAQWRQVSELIEEHLGDDLTLPALAGAASLSKAQFVRLFRSTTGTSPHRYVMRKRVERARELLVRSNLPLVAIATDLGFSSQSHLNRSFRELLGITPGEVRRGR